MREIKERKGKKMKEKDIWTITAPAVPKRIPDTARLAIYITKQSNSYTFQFSITINPCFSWRTSTITNST